MTETAKEKRMLLGDFYIRIFKSHRSITALVCGVIGILDFSADTVLLMTYGGRIRISGRNLVLSVLENKCAEISGGVDGVCFE